MKGDETERKSKKEGEGGKKRWGRERKRGETVILRES